MDFLTGNKKMTNMKSCALLIVLASASLKANAASVTVPEKNATAPTEVTFLKAGHLLLQLGGYWRTAASAQFININDLVGDRFTVNNNQYGNGLVGLGYFIDGKEKDRFKISYGVNGFYLPKTSVSGTVVQENLFENLSYSYNITNYPLYAVAKSTIKTSFSDRNLTVNAGIGPNFMSIGQFKEASIFGDNILTLPDQIFSGKTTTTFSATAGVGFQLASFLGKLPLECGYQFFYLGQGSLNVINSQVQNTLKTGTLYANGVMCSIST